MTNKKSKSDLSDAQIREILAERDPSLMLQRDIVKAINRLDRDMTEKAYLLATYILAECWQALGDCLDEATGYNVQCAACEKIETIVRKVRTK